MVNLEKLTIACQLLTQLPSQSLAPGQSRTPISTNYWPFCEQLFSPTAPPLLHVRCDAHQPTDELYRAVLLTLAFQKYAQNYTAINEAVRQLKPGDVLYSADKHEFRVFVGRRHDGLIEVRQRVERQTQIASASRKQLTEKQLGKLFHLPNASEFKLTRNSTDYFAEYAALFRQALSDNYRALTTFHHRAVVVAPQSVIKNLLAGEFDALPIRFNLDNTKRSRVPVQPLLEVVDNYHLPALKELLFQDKHGLDDVLIFGDAAYQHTVTDMLRDYGFGKIKRLLLFGNQPVLDDQVKFWHWTRPEQTLLHSQQNRTPVTKKIHTPQLLDSQQKLDELATQLIAAGTTPTPTIGLLRQCLTHFTKPVTPVGSEVLAYVTEKLTEYGGPFYELLDMAGLAGERDYWLTQLLAVLQETAQFFHQNQPKRAYIEQLSNDRTTTYIVTKEWQVERLNACFSPLEQRLQGRKKIKAISHQELRTLLKNPDELPKHRRFVLPYLHLNYRAGKHPLDYYRLYLAAASLGEVIVLAYDSIDNQLVDGCERWDERETILHLTHSHRADIWPELGFDWSQLTEAPTPEHQTTITETSAIDNLIDTVAQTPQSTTEKQEEAQLYYLNEAIFRELGVWKYVRQRLKHHPPAFAVAADIASEPPADAPLNIRLHFGSGRAEDYREQTVLAVLQPGHSWKATYSKDILPGDDVLDFTPKFDQIMDALKTSTDYADQIRETRWASKTWREWVREVLHHYRRDKGHTEEKALTEYRRRTGIDTELTDARIKQWLTTITTEPYLFPLQINHLDGILQQRIRLIANTDQIVQREAEADRIRKARDWVASAQRALNWRIVSALTHYQLHQELRPLLAEIQPSALQTLRQTQITRRVVRVETL